MRVPPLPMRVGESPTLTRGLLGVRELAARISQLGDDAGRTLLALAQRPDRASLAGIVQEYTESLAELEVAARRLARGRHGSAPGASLSRAPIPTGAREAFWERHARLRELASDIGRRGPTAGAGPNGPAWAAQTRREIRAAARDLAALARAQLEACPDIRGLTPRWPRSGPTDHPPETQLLVQALAAAALSRGG